jgi:hypothetical protein
MSPGTLFPKVPDSLIPGPRFPVFQPSNKRKEILTNADWGCLDDVHKAWFILEAEDKEEARYVVPPAYRQQATITGLNKFTPDDLDELVRHHQG